MKKGLAFCALGAATLLLTGCGGSGNEVKCTQEMEEDGMKYAAEMIATFEDDKITTAKATMEFDDQEQADQVCQMYQAFTGGEDSEVKVTCDGKKVTMEGPASQLVDEGEITKEEFIKQMEEDGFTCK